MLVTASNGVFSTVDAVWAHARLGIIWWLGCLPVVTAPAATVWLVHAVRKHAAGDVVRGGREAAGYIWARMMPALRLALVHLAVGVYFLVSLNSAIPDGLGGQAIRVVVFSVLATWLLTAPWSFVLLERRERGAWDAIRASYLCALHRPAAATLTLASLLAGAALLWLAPAPVALLAVLAAPPVMAHVPVRCLATVQEKYLNE